MNYYIRAFKKYADFEGRDTRPQYWYFYLINLIAYMVLSVINTEILASIYALVILVPSIAIGVRRLHDIGKSGWWILISLIPVVGWIWIIILLATKGEDKPNKYGEVPKVDEIKEETHHQEVKENEHENKEINHHQEVKENEHENKEINQQ